MIAHRLAVAGAHKNSRLPGKKKLANGSALFDEILANVPVPVRKFFPPIEAGLDWLWRAAVFILLQHFMVKMQTEKPSIHEFVVPKEASKETMKVNPRFAHYLERRSSGKLFPSLATFAVTAFSCQFLDHELMKCKCVLLQAAIVSVTLDTTQT